MLQGRTILGATKPAESAPGLMGAGEKQMRDQDHGGAEGAPLLQGVDWIGLQLALETCLSNITSASIHAGNWDGNIRLRRGRGRCTAP